MSQNNPNALGNIPSDGIKVRECWACSGVGGRTFVTGIPGDTGATWIRCETCKGTGQIVVRAGVR